VSSAFQPTLSIWRGFCLFRFGVKPLVEKIKNHIHHQGPISFRDFMEMALYDAEQGYYARLQEIGPHGDYYTSANIHPLFGELLAEKLASLLRTLDSETALTIVEVGAGPGMLAEDVLRSLQRHAPDVFQNLTYVISELGSNFRLVLQKRLQDIGCVQWKALAELEAESITGIIFSNELIDALPVHRIVHKRGGLRELFVDWREGRFVWTLGDFSSEELKRLVSSWEVSLEEGQIAEVNLSAVQYVRTAAKLLRKGYLVTIDYGEIRPRLYSSTRHEGTLRCFYKHMVTDNPFERIGEQDITASVDFTLLMENGERVGLQTVEFKRQREFMLEQGLMNRLIAPDRTGQDSLAHLKSKLAAKHFLLPGAFGDHFKLLIQRKNCG